MTGAWRCPPLWPEKSATDSPLSFRLEGVYGFTEHPIWEILYAETQSTVAPPS